MIAASYLDIESSSSCESDYVISEDHKKLFRKKAFKIASIFAKISPPSVAALLVGNWIEEILYQLLGDVHEIPPFLWTMHHCIINDTTGDKERTN